MGLFDRDIFSWEIKYISNMDFVCIEKLNNKKIN